MKRIGFVILSILLAILFVGCLKQKSKKDTVEKIRVIVTVAPAVRMNLEQKQIFTGVLAPMKKAALAPLMPGRVNKFMVNIGDRVGQGQILAIMDDGQLVILTSQFQPLKAQYDRALRLYANKAMSKAEFEQIEAQYVAMKRQVDLLQDNTALKAPFYGVITDKTAEEGEIYSPKPIPGRTMGLLELTQLDPLKIDLDVDEKTVPLLKKGMPIQFTVDALPDTVFTGKVEWINPAANELSRTFGVRLLVPNSKGKLMAGYFVRVAIVLGEKQNALAVPEAALIGKKVFVVKDSLALAKLVETGWITSGMAEITSGISEGDRVVVTGNKALPDSALVQVSP
jgi:membrane fusion protein, multidrug efflux system